MCDPFGGGMVRRTISKVAFFMRSAVWERYKPVTFVKRGTMSCVLCKKARTTIHLQLHYSLGL